MPILEESFVTLSGLEQWVTVRGAGGQAPVLLVLHGGPGMPYSVLTPELAAWERDFTVVQWDRRGAGRTFRRHGRACGPVTFAQLVDDAEALCVWLAARLPGAPLVLLSSSAGTPVALPLALRRPDLLAAWVATDVNTGVRSDPGLDATLAWHRVHGARRDVRFLESISPRPLDRSFAQSERLNRLMDKAAGPLGVSAVFMTALKSLALRRPLDFVAILRGMGFSSEQLFEELRTFDAFALPRRLEVPLFVLQGEADPFTPASAARAWFDQVEAPRKHFKLIPGGGHASAFARSDTSLAFLRRELQNL
ncbi:MAG: alpha/beta hydrolase [Deltaproteobacteria bacterium]|nr:alpha/beta hydrolase [Deltaproteobacteria bacterium]